MMTNFTNRITTLESKFNLTSKFTTKNKQISADTLKTIDLIQEATDSILLRHETDDRSNFITHHANNLNTNQSKTHRDLAEKKTYY